MTMTPYIILFIAALAIEMAVTPIFLKYQRPGMSWKSRTTKMICATMFVCLGLLSMKISGNTTQFAMFMLYGLIASWFGDLFLHFKKAPVVLIGGISFFSAHVLYTIAYVKAQKEHFPDYPVFAWYEIVCILAVLAVFVLIAVKTKLRIQKIALCGVIPYAIMITTMTVKAASLAIRACIASMPGSVMLLFTLMAGAILFVLSDGSIVYLMFDERYRKNIPLKNFNIWTYFIGQALLASTIMFLK